jgi:hypothetical protein
LFRSDPLLLDAGKARGHAMYKDGDNRVGFVSFRRACVTEGIETC